jgi:hypothetical protein
LWLVLRCCRAIGYSRADLAPRVAHGQLILAVFDSAWVSRWNDLEIVSWLYSSCCCSLVYFFILLYHFYLNIKIFTISSSSSHYVRFWTSCKLLLSLKESCGASKVQLTLRCRESRTQFGGGCWCRELGVVVCVFIITGASNRNCLFRW